MLMPFSGIKNMFKSKSKTGGSGSAETELLYLVEEVEDSMSLP